MFGKRKKEREQQKIRDLRALRNKQLESAIEDAGKIADPAQRLLRLEEIRQITVAEINRENKAIAEKVQISTGRGVLGGTGFAAAGGAIVATVTTAGLGAIVAVPLLFGGMYAAVKRGDVVASKSLKEAQNYLQTMAQQHDRITRLMKNEVKSNVEEISRSSLKEKVLALPGLAAPFAEAATKHIKEQQEAAPPVAEKKPAAPARKKQSPEYKDLGGL